ncbi:MAG: nitroreductase family deazaflavin-dependent oxidoreductase [Actinomycetota bacterium]
MPIPLAVTRFNKRYLNRAMIKLAGRGHFVDLEHMGRRSGTIHHTVLMAFRHGDTMTIALTYGPDVDWLKNVRAAGRCRMRHRDRLLELGPPRNLTTAEGLARMPAFARPILSGPAAVGEFIELPVLSERVRRRR